MKISEIRQIPAAELSQRIEEEVAKYNQLVLSHSISPLGNPSQIKEQRRTIARLKTVLREIELNNK